MRKVAAIVVAGAIAAWLSMAAAQDGMERPIQDVIARQLAAMDSDDRAAAFAFASPVIQQLFGDAWTFMTMVARNYPQVHHARAHRFLKLETADGQVIQRVLIESDAGTVVARYEMVQIAGAWRINGCSIEAAEGT